MSCSSLATVDHETKVFHFFTFQWRYGREKKKEKNDVSYRNTRIPTPKKTATAKQNL